MGKTPSINKAGGIIIRQDQSGPHVLLILTDRGVFGLPKGFVKKKESLEQAARRECFEETGIVLSPSQVDLGTFKIRGEKIQLFGYEVPGEIAHGDAEKPIRWVKASELEDVLKKKSRKPVFTYLKHLGISE